VEIRPLAASGQTGEIYFYLYTFLTKSPTGQTAHHIFMLDGSNDADSRNGVPFCQWLILQLI